MRKLSIGGSEPRNTMSFAQAYSWSVSIRPSLFVAVTSTRTKTPPGPVSQGMPPAMIAPGTSEPVVSSDPSSMPRTTTNPYGAIAVPAAASKMATRAASR